jgi:flagellar biosynthetic protein FliP
MKKIVLAMIVAIFIGAALEAAAVPLPSLEVKIGEAKGPGDVALVFQVLFILTILSLAPAILMLMTCFTRIVIVLSFLRQALGSQQIPSNQILIGLAIFLTAFLMRPVGEAIYKDAARPYMDGEIGTELALEKAAAPIREFMFRQTGEKELALFVFLSKSERPSSREDIDTLVLIPAFVISELKKAFIIGFFMYLPFLIIDMVVASTLMSMGMMMLPPIMISLPFKILLFVMVDGWNLTVRSISLSFN